VAVDDNAAACVIIGHETEPIRNLLNLTSTSSLEIDNKYFTVSVEILFIRNATEPPRTDLPINAVIVVGAFEQLEDAAKHDYFDACDVKLFIAANPPDREQLQFCFDQHVEYLNIDDEPGRVNEALSCSVWPGAKMKNPAASAPRPTTPPTTEGLIELGGLRDEIDHLSESLEDSSERDFGALLSLINRTRSAGTSLSDAERKANAERIVSAIYGMISDSDSE